MGAYFLGKRGAGQRAGKVIYDRAHSSRAARRSRATLIGSEFSRERAGCIGRGSRPRFRIPRPRRPGGVCDRARRLGLTVSFDVNYRSKLWSVEKARSVLTPMMEHVDLCVSSVEEATTIFGIEAGESKERETVAAQRMRERLGFKMVALTLREASTANRTRWAAMLHSGEQAFFSRSHEVEIVDRLGAGDSFTGALIFALRRGDGPAKAIEFAVAASCHPETCDFWRLQSGDAGRGRGAGGRRSWRARAAVS